MLSGSLAKQVKLLLQSPMVWVRSQHPPVRGGLTLTSGSLTSPHTHREREGERDPHVHTHTHIHTRRRAHTQITFLNKNLLNQTILPMAWERKRDNLNAFSPCKSKTKRCNKDVLRQTQVEGVRVIETRYLISTTCWYVVLQILYMF